MAYISAINVERYKNLNEIQRLIQFIVLSIAFYVNRTYTNVQVSPFLCFPARRTLWYSSQTHIAIPAKLDYNYSKQKTMIKNCMNNMYE